MLVVLWRVRSKVDGYLSASQAGFRRGRSTSDIIWAYRWLAAKAIRFNEPIHVLGLDMSRAFDTIDRQKLMEILKKDVRLEEDDELQDLVLTVHHSFMHTFANSAAVKIVENHMGGAMMSMRGK